ncbi:hypothetical protein BJP27_23405 [Pseudomonas oryzihabitans]|nr:hypothetical protein BJP27_23405 [Pseudomonas psychrotolerans]
MSNITYKTNDQFKNDFSFNLKTQSYKYNQEEFNTFLEQAYTLYSQPGLNYNKALVSAGHFTSATVAIIELSKEGYGVVEDRKALHSGPNYAFFMLKPQTLQNEDREFIKERVMANYLTAIEQNEKVYKAKLKQELIDAERQKEADKAAKQAADKDAKLVDQAEKAFQQILQEEGIQ